MVVDWLIDLIVSRGKIFMCSFRLNSTTIPTERELIFDIDMTDYDEVRLCCSSANICKKCWPLMALAIKIIHRVLTGLRLLAFQFFFLLFALWYSSLILIGFFSRGFWLSESTLGIFRTSWHPLLDCWQEGPLPHIPRTTRHHRLPDTDQG